MAPTEESGSNRAEIEEPSIRADLRILLVEDDDLDRQLFSSVLEELELGVHRYAASVAEAITAMLDEDFDVVFLDLNVVDSTGPQTAIAIATHANAAVIVMTSTQAQPGPLFAAGIEEFINKSDVSPSTIRRTINAALARFSAGQALRGETERLRAANVELKGFAAVAAHDLRAPLFVAAGMLELAIRLSPDAPEDVAEYMARSQQAITRSGLLLDSLLQYATSDAAPLATQTVSVDALVAEVVSHLPQKANVSVDALPSVQGDSAMLYQVFVNLIGNAVKYVAPGVHPQVRVTAESRPGLVVIHVDDNGVGISEELRSRVFEPFVRGHGRDFEGSGLGLATVARVIERHDGSIALADSELGGSRFTVSLPATADTST